MKLRITVHGVAYEVDVDVLDAGDGFPAASALPTPASSPYGSPQMAPAPSHAAPPVPATAASGGGANDVIAPVAGTVQEVKVKVGDVIAVSQVVVVIEAMKMATNIASPHAGRVTQVLVAPGDAVREGQTLVALS